MCRKILERKKGGERFIRKNKENNNLKYLCFLTKPNGT